MAKCNVSGIEIKNNSKCLCANCNNPKHECEYCDVYKKLKAQKFVACLKCAKQK